MNMHASRTVPATTQPATSLPVSGRSVSVAPDGMTYPLPGPDLLAAQMAQIKEHAADSPVVVVQGLGFVGAAAAAVIADASDADGRPRWFVIGVDLPSPQCWWKIAKINEGKTPIQTPDPEFDRLVHRAVLERRNLCATCLEEAYAMAGVIVVDVQLDVTARLAQSLSDIRLDLQGFEAAIRVVGRRMRPDTLVLIETTVPVGACGQIVLPILQAERAKRGIETPVRLAHAYERVMPGPNYVNSIRRFWRTYSGIDRESAVLARNFLSTFIDTANYPLYELERPYDSELAKLLENSYRALNIGFIHEWTLLAEKIGVNLFEVIESIRVRKGTHDNIRYPGFGVGGYCLTKDSLLAQWSALNLFDTDVTLSMTLEALRVNHEMPRHTFDLLQEIVGNKLSGLRVLVCGISYLPELADTRNSPTELLYADLIQAGAVVVLHDPQVARWLERPEAVVASDMRKALAEAEAVVFAVPHRAYRELSVPQLLAAAPRLRAVVDAQNILTDSAAAALHQAGRRVAGVGKGHWRRSGYHLARS